MAVITTIGERLAEIELEFEYQGPLPECKACKVKNICFNLKVFNQYKIKKIREKRHSCSVHDGDVKVVEVEALPIIAGIDKKYIKGSKVKIIPQDCQEKTCSYYQYCTNKAVNQRKSMKIISILEPIPCPKKRELQTAELRD